MKIGFFRTFHQLEIALLLELIQENFREIQSMSLIFVSKVIFVFCHFEAKESQFRENAICLLKKFLNHCEFIKICINYSLYYHSLPHWSLTGLLAKVTFRYEESLKVGETEIRQTVFISQSLGKDCWESRLDIYSSQFAKSIPTLHLEEYPRLLCQILQIGSSAY